MVLLCDALGDGEAQTEAAVPAPGWICPIEALENILLLRRRERRAWDCLQSAGSGGAPIAPDRRSQSWRLGIFPGIVQQDIQHLFEPAGIPVDVDPLGELA